MRPAVQQVLKPLVWRHDSREGAGNSGKVSKTKWSSVGRYSNSVARPESKTKLHGLWYCNLGKDLIVADQPQQIRSPSGWSTWWHVTHVNKIRESWNMRFQQRSFQSHEHEMIWKARMTRRIYFCLWMHCKESTVLTILLYLTIRMFIPWPSYFHDCASILVLRYSLSCRKFQFSRNELSESESWLYTNQQQCIWEPFNGSKQCQKKSWFVLSQHQYP